MRAWKKITIIVLVILLIGGGIALYLSLIDLYKIKGVLKGAKEAFEQEDADGLMAYVSTSYSDDYGFNYPMVRRFMSGLFKDFNKFEVVMENPAIEIQDDTATVQFSLWISVDWNGAPAYIVGTNQKGANVRLHLKKVLMKWQAIKIEGVR